MGIYKRGDHDAPELCLEGSPQNSLSICRIHNVHAGAKCKKSLGTYYHYTRNWCTKTNRAARLRTCHVLGSSRRTPKSSRTPAFTTSCTATYQASQYPNALDQLCQEERGVESRTCLLDKSKTTAPARVSIRVMRRNSSESYKSSSLTSRCQLQRR